MESRWCREEAIPEVVVCGTDVWTPPLCIACDASGENVTCAEKHQSGLLPGPLYHASHGQSRLDTADTVTGLQ